MIDKGAQVKANCSSGFTPLHWAAHNGHIEVVRQLCDRGADVEACTQAFWRGWRPLHFAAENGHISVVKELIEVWNADINARTDRGRTALRVARDNEQANMVVYLISKGGIVP